MSPRLWLVRHAPPLAAQGLCYGRLNLPADAQATQDCARALAGALPTRVHAWHSPLQRCEQLALALQALRPDLASKPDARLQELDFGRWEGLAWSALPRAAIDAWTADFACHPPGDGENLATMVQRVRAALQDARQQALQSQSNVLWISHAGVARCVQWLLQHPSGPLPQAHEWPQEAPALGRWVCVPLPPT
ncbi:MAG: histidine phosphatase family protein [Giesbergeria sp.]